MMISVEEAIKLVGENTPRMSTIKVGLSDALGCVVSEDILSPVNFPPFAQSAMDGYAVNRQIFMNLNLWERSKPVTTVR